MRALCLVLLLAASPAARRVAAADPAAVATRESAESAVKRARSAVTAAPEGAAKRRANGVLAEADVAIGRGKFADAETLARAAQDELAGKQTRLSVVVDADTGETRFLVQEGSVEVSAGGSTAFGHPGEAVRTGGGGMPRVVSAKLSAPAPLDPEDGETLRGVDGRLHWSKVDGANRFTVTVARDALFRDRVATIETEGTSATLGPGLSEGLYHWRVTPTAANGVEGPSSSAITFRLDNHAVAEKPRLYWLRDHHCDAAADGCAQWVAVDTETGIERDVHQIDLKTLKLDARREREAREQLVKGQLAVRGVFRTDRTGVVLVVGDIQGRR